MKRSLLNENTLIEGLQAGGQQRRVFERKLYEHFLSLIRIGVKKYSLDEDTAVSVYSDTIISVIENVVSHRFEGKSTLESYTYQIYMNKCVDAVRKKTTKKNTIYIHARRIDSLIMRMPDRARDIVQLLMESSDQSLMLQKVQEMGEKCKQVLLLFEDGYSDKEIAQQMQYNSAEVVKTTRLRCLERLKEKVLAKKSND